LASVIGRCIGRDNRRTSSLAFAAVGNNLELAIAVSISVWGVASRQALAWLTSRGL
jgi:ACR3 family arsenite transporter